MRQKKGVVDGAQGARGGHGVGGRGGARRRALRGGRWEMKEDAAAGVARYGGQGGQSNRQAHIQKTNGSSHICWR